MLSIGLFLIYILLSSGIKSSIINQKGQNRVNNADNKERSNRNKYLDSEEDILMNNPRNAEKNKRDGASISRDLFFNKDDRNEKKWRKKKIPQYDILYYDTSDIKEKPSSKSEKNLIGSNTDKFDYDVNDLIIRNKDSKKVDNIQCQQFGKDCSGITNTHSDRKINNEAKGFQYFDLVITPKTHFKENSNNDKLASSKVIYKMKNLQSVVNPLNHEINQTQNDDICREKCIKYKELSRKIRTVQNTDSSAKNSADLKHSKIEEGSRTDKKRSLEDEFRNFKLNMFSEYVKSTNTFDEFIAEKILDNNQDKVHINNDNYLKNKVVQTENMITPKSEISSNAYNIIKRNILKLKHAKVSKKKCCKSKNSTKEKNKIHKCEKNNVLNVTKQKEIDCPKSFTQMKSKNEEVSNTNLKCRKHQGVKNKRIVKTQTDDSDIEFENNENIRDINLPKNSSYDAARNEHQIPLNMANMHKTSTSCIQTPVPLEKSYDTPSSCTEMHLYTEKYHDISIGQSLITQTPFTIDKTYDKLNKEKNTNVFMDDCAFHKISNEVESLIYISKLIDAILIPQVKSNTKSNFDNFDYSNESNLKDPKSDSDNDHFFYSEDIPHSLSYPEIQPIIEIVEQIIKLKESNRNKRKVKKNMKSKSKANVFKEIKKNSKKMQQYICLGNTGKLCLDMRNFTTLPTTVNDDCAGNVLDIVGAKNCKKTNNISDNHLKKKFKHNYSTEKVEKLSDSINNKLESYRQFGNSATGFYTEEENKREKKMQRRSNKINIKNLDYLRQYSTEMTTPVAENESFDYNSGRKQLNAFQRIRRFIDLSFGDTIRKTDIRSGTENNKDHSKQNTNEHKYKNLDHMILKMFSVDHFPNEKSKEENESNIDKMQELNIIDASTREGNHQDGRKISKIFTKFQPENNIETNILKSGEENGKDNSENDVENLCVLRNIVRKLKMLEKPIVSDNSYITEDLTNIENAFPINNVIIKYVPSEMKKTVPDLHMKNNKKEKRQPNQSKCSKKYHDFVPTKTTTTGLNGITEKATLLLVDAPVLCGNKPDTTKKKSFSETSTESGEQISVITPESTAAESTTKLSTTKSLIVKTADEITSKKIDNGACDTKTPGNRCVCDMKLLLEKVVEIFQNNPTPQSLIDQIEIFKCPFYKSMPEFFIIDSTSPPKITVESFIGKIKDGEFGVLEASYDLMRGYLRNKRNMDDGMVAPETFKHEFSNFDGDNVEYIDEMELKENRKFRNPISDQLNIGFDRYLQDSDVKSDPKKGFGWFNEFNENNNDYDFENPKTHQAKSVFKEIFGDDESYDDFALSHAIRDTRSVEKAVKNLRSKRNAGWNRKKRLIKIDTSKFEKSLQNLHPFKLKKGEIYVLPNEPATIFCSDETKSIPGSYEWKMADGKNLNSSERIVVENYKLLFSKVMLEDSGSYSCTRAAEKNVKPQNHHHMLTIVEVPLYTMLFALFYSTSNVCQKTDLDVISLHLPSLMSQNICAEGKLCSITIEEPHCFEPASDRKSEGTGGRLAATGVLRVATYSPPEATSSCGPRCRRSLRASLAAVIGASLPGIVLTPVKVNLPYRNEEYHPVSGMGRQWKKTLTSPKDNDQYHSFGSKMRALDLDLVIGCPEGFELNADNKICLACAVGYYSASGEAICHRCDRGTYAPSAGCGACLKCTDNTIPGCTDDTDRSKVYTIIAGVTIGIVAVIVLFHCLFAMQSL